MASGAQRLRLPGNDGVLEVRAERVDQPHAAQFLAPGIECRMQVKDARLLSLRGHPTLSSRREIASIAAASPNVGAWPTLGTVTAYNTVTVRSRPDNGVSVLGRIPVATSTSVPT